MSEQELSFCVGFQDQPPIHAGGYFTVVDHPAAVADCTNQICNSGERLLESEASLKTAAAATGSYGGLVGFNKLDLPRSFPAPLRRTASDNVNCHLPPSPLRRTASDNLNCHLPPPPYYQETHIPSGTSFEPPPQGNPFGIIRNSAQESHRSPNAVPLVRRTVSDQTPPRPPRPRNGSPSPRDSPSAKRLRRIQDRMKEIKQWCDEVVLESNEEEIAIPKEQSEEEQSENPSEEAVCVEEDGDMLALRLKCTCGKGFEVLLSGKSCYYKLTS